MAQPWVDQDKIRRRLATFFRDKRKELTTFGLTVNQTFEAFVFATVVRWYKSKKWRLELKNPVDEAGMRYVKLKFSTRGRPGGYTYAECRKGRVAIHVRHGLRVATRSYRKDGRYKANICLDVAVIRASDLSAFSSNDHVENRRLLTFGEAKHMSAFAELVAAFIGLAHEMRPDVLKRVRKGGRRTRRRHPAPFLYVSGHLLATAQGIHETIKRRGYDVDIYDNSTPLLETEPLPVMTPKKIKPKKTEKEEFF